MATIGFVFRKSESGGTVEIKQCTMTEDGKAGDVIVKTSGTENTCDLMDDTAELPLGVLLHDVDASESATAQFIPVREDYVFEVECTSDEKYVDAADKYTTCDIDTFTSGSFGIDPATASNNHVFLLGLADGESDDTNGNKVLCKFNSASSAYKR